MKIGVVILAAGMGRRLGRGVKALVPVAGKALIDHLLEKSGENVIVYTSQFTHEPIKAYLKSRHPFLLKEQGDFPQGNGTLYASLCGSPIFQEWIDKRIERICVIPIDNPLAQPLNPRLNEGDLAVVGVMKQSPDEKMGSIVDKEGTIKIVEYSELTDEERLKYLLGYAGIFSAKINFFLKSSQSELPWHKVIRGGEEHREKFLFDAFGLAKSPKVVICDRKGHFCPVKGESDIALVEELLYNRVLK